MRKEISLEVEIFSVVHWDTGDHFALDATLVDAAFDLEESIVAPVRIPRISAQPIFFAVFLAPAEYANRMPAKCLASVVAVDARLVGWKVLVDNEGAFDRTIVENIAHDLFFARWKSVRLLSVMFVLDEASLVFVYAIVLACRRGSLFAGARGSFAIGVMFAGFNCVGLATGAMPM